MDLHPFMYIRRILFPACQTDRDSHRTYIHQDSHLKAEEIGVDDLHEQLFGWGEGEYC